MNEFLLFVTYLVSTVSVVFPSGREQCDIFMRKNVPVSTPKVRLTLLREQNSFQDNFTHH